MLRTIFIDAPFLLVESLLAILFLILLSYVLPHLPIFRSVIVFGLDSSVAWFG